jgi:hypothetical protein
VQPETLTGDGFSKLVLNYARCNNNKKTNGRKKQTYYSYICNNMRLNHLLFAKDHAIMEESGRDLQEAMYGIFIVPYDKRLPSKYFKN